MGYAWRRGCHSPSWRCGCATCPAQLILRAGVRPTWVKALLHLEPAAATLVGAANLLGGVAVLLLFAPSSSRLRGKPLAQVLLVRMMAAQPASRPFLKTLSWGQLGWRVGVACCGDVGVGGAAGWVDGGMCPSAVVFFGVASVAVHYQNLPWLPWWCGELCASGVVSVHLCSMMPQGASPTC